MPKCGSQCFLCDLPIRFDTYVGCSHGCKYCFVQRKTDIKTIEPGETPKALVPFIEGQRTQDTNWADWNIPLHWGGVSDPFQPCEKIHLRTLDALKIFVETQYPVVISTKGALCVEEPYLSLLKEANCVMQISMVCDKYDSLEPGAPPYRERARFVNELAKAGKRVNIRVQPYITDVFEDVKRNIPMLANAGAYGMIFEGMKFVKKKPGLVKAGGDWVHPVHLLQRDFTVFREECHSNGMKFYSGENRLRAMGDSLTCCGVDGLPGFESNAHNLNHLINGDSQRPSAAQAHIGTAKCFKAIFQTTLAEEWLCGQSFSSVMRHLMENKRGYVHEVFGK